MENAAKALIMAAGILIGVIVLGIFAYEFLVISDTGEQYGKEIRQREVSQFNSQFEPYAYYYGERPKQLKAQDVVTLLYLVRDWNQNNESDQIEVSLSNSIRNNYGTEDNFKYELFLSQKSIILKDDEHTSYAVFECSIDEYDKNGRISKMTIKETGNIITDKDGNETFKNI